MAGSSEKVKHENNSKMVESTANYEKTDREIIVDHQMVITLVAESSQTIDKTFVSKKKAKRRKRVIQKPQKITPIRVSVPVNEIMYIHDSIPAHGSSTSVHKNYRLRERDPKIVFSTIDNCQTQIPFKEKAKRKEQVIKKLPKITPIRDSTPIHQNNGLQHDCAQNAQSVMPAHGSTSEHHNNRLQESYPKSIVSLYDKNPERIEGMHDENGMKIYRIKWWGTNEIDSIREEDMNEKLKKFVANDLQKKSVELEHSLSKNTSNLKEIRQHITDFKEKQKTFIQSSFLQELGLSQCDADVKLNV